MNNELYSILKKKLRWHGARISFLTSFITALNIAGTVNLRRVAARFPSSSKTLSNYRRIQRFYAKFEFDTFVFSEIIHSLLPGTPPYSLSIDRTQWDFGKLKINILMISVCYDGVALPLVWTLLPHDGNSDQEQRIRLMMKCLRLIPRKQIKSLLGDREFIGKQWFFFLKQQKIPFVIRIKENQKIRNNSHIKSLFCDLRLNTKRELGRRIKITGQYFYVSGLKRLDKKHTIEYVILVSNIHRKNLFDEYKERWQIETMFRAFKSSGFRIEDTHLTSLERIDKLLAVLCLAFVWLYRIGLHHHLHKTPIRVKSHGRKEYSYFSYGFHILVSEILNSMRHPDGVSDPLREYIQLLSCT